MSIFAAIAAALIAAPAAAEAPQSDTRPSTEAISAQDAGGAARPEEKKAERKQCKKFQNIGSNMGAKRVCLTRSEWKKAGF